MDQLFMGSGLKDITYRYLPRSESERRASAKYDSKRTDILAIFPAESREAAKNRDFVEIMMKHKSEIGEAVLAVTYRRQLCDTIGKGIWMANTFSLDDLDGIATRKRPAPTNNVDTQSCRLRLARIHPPAMAPDVSRFATALSLPWVERVTNGRFSHGAAGASLQST